MPLRGGMPRGYRQIRMCERGGTEGLLDDVTIFVRPLPALAALFATLPPRVSARRRGRLTGAVALVATRPLALAVGGADRFTPRFL